MKDTQEQTGEVVEPSETDKERRDRLRARQLLFFDRPAFENIEQFAEFVRHCRASYEDGPSMGSTTQACIEIAFDEDRYGVGIETCPQVKPVEPEPPLHLTHDHLLRLATRNVRHLGTWVAIDVEGQTTRDRAEAQGLGKSTVHGRLTKARTAIMEKLARGGHDAAN